ncbi:MAG TPA: GNAT family N-acetyltransferase [Kofleriaceae bacterium]
MTVQRRAWSAGTSMPSAAWEAALDAQILRDLAPYYGELEYGFAATHLVAIGASLASIGFSTIAKLGWAIHARDRVIGKAVCTVKRGGSLKIGPIALIPDCRHQGHATSFLQSVVARARENKRPCVFATVPTENGPAQRLFERAGFRRAGALVDHYRPGCSEDVMVYLTSDAPSSPEDLSDPDIGAPRASSSAERVRCYVAEQFFPVDDAWERWLALSAGQTLGEFERKPHDLVEDDRGGTALVIYKRGGTAKIVPVVAGSAAISLALVRVCEQAARRRDRRKVSMFLPAHVRGPTGYRRELEAIGYSIRGPVAVWSRLLA